MKTIAFLLFLVLSTAPQGFTQSTETFDIISYNPPKGWQKELNKDAVQFGIDDRANDRQALITLFRSVPASADPRINFDTAWQKMVSEIVTVSGKPRMQPSANENGWTVESGFAGYESDGRKGLVMLLTLTGGSDMVNILTFTNTDAYQQIVTEFLASISLPKIAPFETTSSADRQTEPSRNPRLGSYKFTITNFDDGWKAAEEADWVKVTKGNTVVLIHYSVPDIRRFNNLDESTAHVWNTLVAPRYKNASNIWMRRSWYADGDFMNAKYFGEADVIDNATGKKVHVALFKDGTNGRWIEFISPDKAAFQTQFSPVYAQDGTDWNKLSVMGNYNKFAVAAEDLVGNWYSASGSNIQYYNVYTGNSAGMAFSSSNTEIGFQSNGTYKSVYKGVDNTQSGGGNRYHGETFTGKFTVTNWEMKLTNRFKGATDTFAIQFEAVKGGRILHMYRGSIEELHLFKMK